MQGECSIRFEPERTVFELTCPAPARFDEVGASPPRDVWYWRAHLLLPTSRRPLPSKVHLLTCSSSGLPRGCRSVRGCVGRWGGGLRVPANEAGRDLRQAQNTQGKLVGQSRKQFGEHTDLRTTDRHHCRLESPSSARATRNSNQSVPLYPFSLLACPPTLASSLSLTRTST
eukprot:scaffold21788_cov31-Tisochrysis_lutea.AAC.1